MLTRFAILRFDALVAMTCFVALATFGWHGILGSRSLDYKVKLQARAGLLEERLEVLSIQRKAMEKRVMLMRPESVDPDMVEELVRGNLGLAKPTDLIIKIKR
jgi:cell division protein FtsB